MSLVVEDLFWQVLVFFINGCSADCCDFGVPVRGGELRVFLLGHLGQSPEHSFLTPDCLQCQDSGSSAPEDLRTELHSQQTFLM